MLPAVKLAHVSTFPPARCGIAIYADDLVRSLQDDTQIKVAITSQARQGSTLAAVDVDSGPAAAGLARRLSGEVDLVSLQHEFGIWGGGRDGRHLLDFLDALTVPLVATVHTVPGPTEPVRRGLLQSLLDRSAKIVVLNAVSRDQLRAGYRVAPGRLAVIPHGVDPVPGPALRAWGEGEPLRIICPGFLRRGKGHHTALLALWLLKNEGIPLRCTIVGHDPAPGSRSGKVRSELEALIQRLELRDEVTLMNSFASRDELADTIGRHHVALCAYQDATQVSSGIVPSVLAAGRPVVATPFPYAVELARTCAAVSIAPCFAPDALSSALLHFARTPDDFAARVEAAQGFAMTSAWPRAATAYRAVFAAALA